MNYEIDIQSMIDRKRQVSDEVDPGEQSNEIDHPATLLNYQQK